MQPPLPTKTSSPASSSSVSRPWSWRVTGALMVFMKATRSATFRAVAPAPSSMKCVVTASVAWASSVRAVPIQL
jgi:hypothetical protein